MNEFIRMTEEEQINYLSNEDQRKIFIDEYNKNPNLILFCTRGANQKLIELGLDIASYDKIFMNFDGGKDILQDYSFYECLKKYRALGTSDCFEYVKGDNNCAVWSSIQAFRQALGGEKINFDDPKEFDAMAKLRLDVAGYCAQNIQIVPKELYEIKTVNEWTNPDFFMQYLSKKNNNMKYVIIDRTYNSETKKIGDKDFAVIFSDFQNMINGCPFVYFVNDNHFINLKPDGETRKKFMPLFYDFYKSYLIHTFFILKEGNSSACRKKNNIIWTMLGFLFRNMSEETKNGINKIMDDFLKDVAHKYKPVLTFKLILFIFEKYKNKVLDTLNFKITANEFLSDVLVDFKKEVVDKDPEFSKKQEGKKNMQVDVDEIFKKFDIEIGNNISFKDENFGYLKTISYDLYNNYADDDIPKDNNCLFWSALEILEKRKINENVDRNKMFDLRKKIGEWCKEKYGWNDDNKDYRDIITPGIMAKSDYVCKYLAYKTKTGIFDFYCFGTGGDFNSFCKDDLKVRDELNLKDTFFSVIDGAHCFVGDDIHNKILRYGPEQRKKFYLNFFDLYMIRGLCPYYCKNISYCAKFLRKLFYDNWDACKKLKGPIEELIKTVSDELKPQKLCELGVFTYKKFKSEVLEKENKDITADEFYSSVFKEFKEKYIDNDPDLKQNKKTEENKEEPSKDSKSESKINPDPNHESQETTEPQIEPGPENTPKDPDLKPNPTVDQTNQRPKTNKQKNDQQTNKNKEKDDNKKDENHDKQKSESKKKIFSGPKWLYIFLCIITLSIFYFFRSSPETKENKLPSEKDKESNDNKNDKSQIDDEKDKILGNKEESDKNLKTKKPLSGLANNNSQTKKDDKNLSDRGSLLKHRE